MENSEHLPGLSDDVGAGFISGHSNQSASGPELNVDRLVEFSPSDEVGGMGMSKVIRVDQKRFFFDLGSNNRGHFLRISEVNATKQSTIISIIVLSSKLIILLPICKIQVAGPDRSSIILPLSGLRQFHEMIGHFVDITKDRLDGMTGANVRTVEPTQR